MDRRGSARHGSEGRPLAMIKVSLFWNSSDMGRVPSPCWPPQIEASQYVGTSQQGRGREGGGAGLRSDKEEYKHVRD